MRMKKLTPKKPLANPASSHIGTHIGATVIAFSLFSGAALAGGFQISETSVTGLARAFAGAGISADGPADMFHNPAGLMLGTGKQFEIGINVIDQELEFEDRGSADHLFNSVTVFGVPGTTMDGGIRVDSNGIPIAPNAIIVDANDTPLDSELAGGLPPAPDGGPAIGGVPNTPQNPVANPVDDDSVIPVAPGRPGPTPPRVLASDITVRLPNPAVAVAIPIPNPAIDEGLTSAATDGFSRDSMGRVIPSTVLVDSAGMIVEAFIDRPFDATTDLNIPPPNPVNPDGSIILGSGFTTTYTSTGRADAGETTAVPNLFYAGDISKNARFGFGITSPFGFDNEYSPNWVGRYHAIKSELETLEVNPTIALRVNDAVNLGFGLTVVNADAEFTRAELVDDPGTTSVDNRDNRLSRITGDDTAVGYTFGITAGDKDSRIGFGYRSRVELELDGEIEIPSDTLPDGTPAGDVIPAVSQDVDVDFTLPATAHISGFKRINDKFDLLATIRWTQWSDFDRVEFDYGNAPPTNAETSQQHNWEDSYTFSIGGNYRPSERWILRAGYARDASPIRSAADRTATIPDRDREWLTIGGSYQATSRARIDFSFAHVRTESGDINQSRTVDVGTITQESILRGEYDDNTTNVFSVQLHIQL